MAAMPGRDVEMLERRSAVQGIVPILGPLAWEKKRKRRAVRGVRSVVRRRWAEAIEGRLRWNDIVQVCKVGLVLLLDRLGVFGSAS